LLPQNPKFEDPLVVATSASFKLGFCASAKVLTLWWKPWGFVGSYGNEVISSTLAEEQNPNLKTHLWVIMAMR
jgi:hypothetical protein